MINDIFCLNCSDYILKVRSRSRRYRLVGLFAHAHVIFNDESDDGKYLMIKTRITLSLTMQSKVP